MKPESRILISADLMIDDSPEPRSYSIIIDRRQYNAVQCYGTDSYVDAFVHMLIDCIKVSRGELIDPEIAKDERKYNCAEYREGSKLSIVLYGEDRHIQECLSYEVIDDESYYMTYNTSDAIIKHRVLFDGTTEFTEGVNIAIGLILRKRAKNIINILDHISVFDTVTWTFYTTDKEVEGFINSDITTDMQKDIHDTFGGGWGPILLSSAKGNYTVVIVQSDYSITNSKSDEEIKGFESMCEKFVGKYPDASPITAIFTWSLEYNEKRSIMSGGFGKLLHKYFDGCIKGFNNPNDSILGSILSDIAKNSPTEEESFNYFNQEAGEPMEITEDGLVPLSESDDKELYSKAPSKLIIGKVVADLVDNGVDYYSIAGVVASLDSRTNEICFSYVDMDGGIHPLTTDEDGHYLPIDLGEHNEISMMEYLETFNSDPDRDYDDNEDNKI